MNRKKWLLLDVSYLCHRAYHTGKELSWKGKSTGVIFGFLKSISAFKDQFETDDVVFCFDSLISHRKLLMGGYKAKRHSDKTPEEVEAYNLFCGQVLSLRNRYLFEIGFKNVAYFDGFEADDVIASLALNLPRDQEAVIVSADRDLWQCLRPNVSMYSPHQRRECTYEGFMSEHGYTPSKWAVVKAIAGCSSDEVPGVRGVGELTAERFVQGKLQGGSRLHRLIVGNKVIVRRNRRLVELPFEGCPLYRLQEDDLSSAGWRRVCGELGMKSLAGRLPVASRKALR